MRIAIATVQVPFVSGGAEYHVEGLKAELIKAGHIAEIISAPFRFDKRYLADDMAYWQRQDFRTLGMPPPDGVIAMKFPSYLLQHPCKTLWLLHQHRAVYELLDTPWGEQSGKADVDEITAKIKQADCAAISAISARYTISQTVTDRLQRYNGISSQPLYHPPPNHELLNPNGAIFPYIFAPSRLEPLKRQDLLIKAMPFVDQPMTAIICGSGMMQKHYQQLALKLGVADRVRFTGFVTNEQIRRYYSHSLAVFFGPYQEDLGYVTLEAMLSAKPVITCKDSGGITEFVMPNDTGAVIEPDPEQIAVQINRLWHDRRLAREMGRNGLQRYKDLNISWDNVVQKLTEGMI